MMTLLKGLLALPVAVLIIAAICLLGALLMSLVAVIAAATCVVVPFLLKLACIAFVIFGTLWLLGTIVTEIQKSFHNN